MKTELRVKPHSELMPGQVVEVWHNGQFIATIYGSDSPGVRIFSRHRITPFILEGTPNLMEAKIDVGS